MKKLIAIAVVFALVSGVAFAVDLGGTVIGRVGLLESGKNDDGDDAMFGSASLSRIRLEGSGEAGDGKFGGWLRFSPQDIAFQDENSINVGTAGIAWWKPIDQLKVVIGGNPDGIWGKEGVTGWMFAQTAYDSGVTLSEDNIWSGDGLYKSGLKFRNAFYKGYTDNYLALEINPIDMLGINIALPYFDGVELKDIFKGLIAQLDVKLDFGNIAITYEGAPSYIQKMASGGWDGDVNGGTIFGYFGGSFGDLSLDIGFGFELDNTDDDGNTTFKNPFAVGLGLKYAADAFGVKVRAVASFPTENDAKYSNKDQPLKILADLLPYYVINDTTRAFLNVGLGITSPKEGDAVTGFYLNPWLEVGEEWGAKFLVGFKLWSTGIKQANGDPATTNWAVPISIIVSF